MIHALPPPPLWMPPRPAIVRAVALPRLGWPASCRATFPFPLFCPKASAAAGPTLSFVNSYVVTGDGLGNYSFASIPIGTATATRQVFVILYASDPGTPAGPTYVQDGSGNNYTAVAVNGQAFFATCGIYRRNITSGTTTTLNVGWNNAPTRVALSVYVVDGLSSTTPTDTGSSNADPGTDTLTTTPGGILIGGGGTIANTTATISGTGVTGDTPASGSSIRLFPVSASAIAGSSISPSIDYSTASNVKAAFATFF